MWKWSVKGGKGSDMTIVIGSSFGRVSRGAVSRIEEMSGGYAWSTRGKSGRAGDWAQAVDDLKAAMMEIEDDR